MDLSPLAGLVNLRLLFLEGVDADRTPLKTLLEEHNLEIID